MSTTTDKKQNSEIMDKLRGYFHIYSKQKTKNNAQKVATLVSTLFHLFAYLPLVSNLLYLLEKVKLRPELLKIPVMGWFIRTFHVIHTDFLTFIIWTAVLLWAIPLAVYMIIHFTSKFINSGNVAAPLTGTPAEEAKKIHRLGNNVKCAWFEDRYLTKAAALCGLCVGSVFAILNMIYVEVALFGEILFVGLLTACAALLSLPLKWMTEPMKQDFAQRNVLAEYNDELYEFWVSFDPEERKRKEEAEREERRRAEQAEREARRREEEERIRRNTQIIVHYDDSIDTYGNLSLTLYIDGSSHRLRPGRNAFTVSPGNHTLDCIVYNDGSESCSSLGEMKCYVPSGQSYEIDIPG